MSRDKFEEWFIKRFGSSPVNDVWDNDIKDAFIAGRASMQDEAAAEAEQGIWMCKTSEEIIDSIGKAIREIEP